MVQEINIASDGNYTLKPNLINLTLLTIIALLLAETEKNLIETVRNVQPNLYTIFAQMK